MSEIGNEAQRTKIHSARFLYVAPFLDFSTLPFCAGKNKKAPQGRDYVTK